MSSFRKQRTILLISFNLLLVGLSGAQSLQETIAFADFQYDQGNYSEAIADYSRAIFFDKGAHQEYLHQKIASSYFLSGDYQKAWLHYNVAWSFCSNDGRVCNNYIYKMANCKILEHQYKQALIDLFGLDLQTAEDSLKYHFYLATVYFALEDFDRAISYFIQSIPENDSIKKGELEKLFSNRKDLYRPNPKTAKILSVIIPGMGQFYSGNIQDGFNSMLLTGGIIVLATVIIQNYGVVDGLVSAAPWYQRYFQGGYTKAEQVAVDKRQKKRNQKYREAVDIILK